MIELQNLKPIPLIETANGLNPDSHVFGTGCLFEKGKNYLLTAPSGKGKSTLLHILYGLRTDYEGEVIMNGQNIKIYTADHWAECRQQRLSLVFQDLRLFPKLTAWENILLKASLKKSLPATRIREMADNLGITAVLNQKSETLSYGQRQRVAIVRALCQPFDFLLLDEPFSNLDAENTASASMLIQEQCQQQNAGFLLTSLGERYTFTYDAIWEL